MPTKPHRSALKQIDLPLQKNPPNMPTNQAPMNTDQGGGHTPPDQILDQGVVATPIAKNPS